MSQQELTPDRIDQLNSPSVVAEENELPQQKKGNKWFKVLQIIIGLAAMALVISRIDRHELVRGLAQVKPIWLVWAVIINVFQAYLMGVRWHFLMRVKYPKVGSLILFRQYIIGQFFNLFTPGAVGGDVSRLIAIGRITGDRSFVFATLIIDRMAGFCGLVLGGIIGIYLGRNYLDHPATYYTIAFILLAGLLASSMFLSAKVTGFIVNIVKSIEARLKRNLASKMVEKIASQFAVFGNHGLLITGSVLFTIIIRLVWVLSFWLVAKAFNINIAFSILMAFIAIVDIARMAPIAMSNGLGVREYLMVMLLGQVGVPSSQALLFSLIAYTLLMANGLIGYFLYTFGGLSPKQQTVKN